MAVELLSFTQRAKSKRGSIPPYRGDEVNFRFSGRYLQLLAENAQIEVEPESRII